VVCANDSEQWRPDTTLIEAAKAIDARLATVDSHHAPLPGNDRYRAVSKPQDWRDLGGYMQDEATGRRISRGERSMTSAQHATDDKGPSPFWGPAVVLIAPVIGVGAQFFYPVRWAFKASDAVVAVIGTVVICYWFHARVTPPTAEDESVSTCPDVWKKRLTETDKKEAFKYFQKKYFHQDLLMWERLPLFIVLQAGLVFGVTTEYRFTGCLAIGFALFFGTGVLELFLQDDKFRRAARAAMEAAADQPGLKVPIVGAGAVYRHPDLTRPLLALVIFTDIVCYVLRSWIASGTSLTSLLP
jgi:hypothetical protein